MTMREYLIANLHPKDAKSIIAQARVDLERPYDHAGPIGILETGYFTNPLSRVVIWDHTDEGNSYWFNINQQLGEKYLNGELVISE